MIFAPSESRASNPSILRNPSRVCVLGELEVECRQWLSGRFSGKDNRISRAKVLRDIPIVYSLLAGL